MTCSSSDPRDPAAAPGRYPVPARIHRFEETIRASRFLTLLAHAPDADAAHAFIERVRGEHPDATHHCWAFVAGPPGSTAAIGMSDAGEPHGTAGRPMLTALLHGGVGEIVAVCARWYGGTKLGTGGLARAYAGGVKGALASLPTVERVERVPLRVTVGYAHVDAVQRLLDELEAVVTGEAYGADVRYGVDVPAARVAELEGRLADITRGEAALEADEA
ncbi:MAG TPA: YigZ family protein [Longimicrobiales bacterium]|nr:YigZ family protein [Longimicrobiales bacterium]